MLTIIITTDSSEKQGQKGYQRHCASSSYRKMFSLVKEMSIYQETQRFHKRKRKGCRSQKSNRYSPHPLLQTWGHFYFSSAQVGFLIHFTSKNPVKAGLMKRQEKTHHILGSLRSTLLTLTKYSRQTCPVASCEEANPSPPFPRQTFRAPEQHSTDLLFLLPHDIQQVLTYMAETLFVCCYNLCIIFTEDKLNNLVYYQGINQLAADALESNIKVSYSGAKNWERKSFLCAVTLPHQL